MSIETPPRTHEEPKNFGKDGISFRQKNELEHDPMLKERMRTYSRGKEIPIDEVNNRTLKERLRKTEEKFQDVVKKAAKAEILLTEEQGYIEAEGIEKTYKFRQEDIVQRIDTINAKKRFDLKLDLFGPYLIDYSRNGRYLLFGGKKGHVAAIDWKSGKLICEMQLKETVRDVQWLHNELFFAIAQKKYVHIYDKSGLEVHRLKKHIDVNKLEFLPYHFLLASIGNAGYLKYQDTSTGELVAELRTKMGPCGCMSQNPANAIIHLGHGNGIVSLWSPTITTPLVKMLCHKGPVTSLAVDPTGSYMVSTGLDGKMKVWDLRTYKCLQDYYTLLPASNLDISQTGLLGVGYGSHVQIWKDAFLTKQPSPYLTHEMPGHMVSSLYFAPFEDVLGVGHSRGFSSILVPGAGQANIDTLELNPFETKRQRQESEVKMLLEKLQPEMIRLDVNFIGNLNRTPKEDLQDIRKVEFEANHPDKQFKAKYKARGKSSSLRRYLRKQGNVIDQKKELIKKRLQQAQLEKERKKAGFSKESLKKTALDRFLRTSH